MDHYCLLIIRIIYWRRSTILWGGGGGGGGLSSCHGWNHCNRKECHRKTRDGFGGQSCHSGHRFFFGIFFWFPFLNLTFGMECNLVVVDSAFRIRRVAIRPLNLSMNQKGCGLKNGKLGLALDVSHLHNYAAQYE